MRRAVFTILAALAAFAFLMLGWRVIINLLIETGVDVGDSDAGEALRGYFATAWAIGALALSLAAWARMSRRLDL
jgi:hypothetical protein